MWTFECTGFHAGDYNMRYDESLAHQVAEGLRSSTVRVFGWNPPAISLGRNQSIEELDTGAAARAGVDVVRRPTGGRAILHAEEITYSVVMPADGRSIAAVYRDISRALVCGLEQLGVHATLEHSQPHFPSLYGTDSGTICFSSSARSEIKVNGRKLVGSAQRRFFLSHTEIILQHGSILLGPAHRRIVEFLGLPSEEGRRRVALELSQKTTDLESILGYRPSFEQVATAICVGFENAWGIEFEPAFMHPHQPMS